MIIPLVEILCIIVLIMVFSTLIIEERKNRVKRINAVKLKGYWDGSERRGADRLNLSLDVKYFENGNASGVKTIDISAKGIRLVLDEKFVKDITLRLEIRLPDDNHLIKARGIVVWCEEESEEGSSKRLFSTGIKFYDFHGKDEKRLFDFIYKQQPQSL
ncbi:MAG: PilZ domain-containing protein [Candidatus Omnitrophota bacterium]